MQYGERFNNIVYYIAGVMIAQKLASASLFIYLMICSAVTNITLNRIALLVMTGLCSYSWLLRRKGRLVFDLQTSCLAFYGIIMFITSFFATGGPRSHQQVALIAFVTMFVLVFFVKENIKSKKDIEFFLLALVLAGVIQFLVMLSVYGTGIITALLSNDSIGTRLGDEEANSNMVGMSFMLSGISALYFLLQSNSKVKKIGYSGLMIIMFALGLMSGSRKAFLMLFLGSGMLLYGNSQNKNNFIKKVGLVFISLLLLMLSYSLIRNLEAFSVITERVDELVEGTSGGALDSSAEERYYMMEVGWRVFLRAPLLGEGLCASSNYFGTYSHNNYIELLMNTGIIGLIVFYIPIIRNGAALLTLKNRDLLGWLMSFLCCWLLIGSLGMVIYYDKTSMVLFMLINMWLALPQNQGYGANYNVIEKN